MVADKERQEVKNHSVNHLWVIVCQIFTFHMRHVKIGERKEGIWVRGGQQEEK